jgi:hypothetical protein
MEGNNFHRKQLIIGCLTTSLNTYYPILAKGTAAAVPLFFCITRNVPLRYISVIDPEKRDTIKMSLAFIF